MPATRPISPMRGTSPTTVPSARRRNIPSPRSSVAPTAASRPNFCSIRVRATFSSCVLPAISSTTTASRASNMPSSSSAPLVMILGHTNCGAIDAAIKVVKEGIELPGHLPELIKSIKPAVIAAHARHPSDLLAAATEENVRLNMKRLYDHEPIMTEPLAAQKLAIEGGVYDIATGKVNLL